MLHLNWWYGRLMVEKHLHPDAGLHAWYWMPDLYLLISDGEEYHVRSRFSWRTEHWIPGLTSPFPLGCRHSPVWAADALEAAVLEAVSLFLDAFSLAILVPLAAAVGRISDLLAPINGADGGGRPCLVLRT